MPRRRFLKKRHGNEDMVLQITAMADIFTVLLIFLLKSYSSDVTVLSPSASVNLPVARGGDSAEEALKVEVSENDILVEGKPAAKLANFEFTGNDLLSNGTSRSLQRSIATERQRQLEIAKQNPEVKADSKIIIMADQRTPYDTLKAVLASAAVHGFTDFKMIVVKEE